VEVLNPYKAGPPLRDEKGFFGRKDDLEWVLRELRNPGNSALVLHGQRRIGKTSLLHLLKRNLPTDEFTPVYFDLQDQAFRSLDDVLSDLAHVIADEIEFSIPTDFDINQWGNLFQKNFLPTIFHQIGNRRLILILDEFDVIDQIAENDLNKHAAANSLLPFFRKLINEEEQLAFVFVAGRRPQDLSLDFFATFKTSIAKELWVLDDQSARDLIQQAEFNRTLQFSSNAIDRILALTNRHPYITQLLCQRIWENAYASSEKRTPLIDVDEVDSAISDVLETGTPALEWWWDGLSHAERIYAAAFAEISNEGEAISEDTVIQAITQHAARLRKVQVELAPKDLVKRRVLNEIRARQYCFAVELFRRWVSQNKPLKVVKDELDSVDLQADRLFGVGESYFRQGEYEKAIQYLEDSVVENPYHFKAHLYLGDALLETGNVLDAVANLENAYALDREEARLALARALVKLGSQFEKDNKDDDALNAYERTLEVSPSEKQAQESISAIWNRRGDKALENKDFQTASFAFEKSGDLKKAKIARKYQDEEEELTRLFNEGLGAIQQNDWMRAEKALKEVVYRHPDYQRSGRRAIDLLTLAIEGSKSKLTKKRIISDPSSDKRPAIIIGLGGTGQWVLTYLKKELLETNAGKMPQNVKLIAFDTTSTTSKTWKVSNRDDDEISAGSLKLIAEREFFSLGENVSQVVREIAEGNHPHLQWFPARTFQEKFPPAVFNIKEGSGQIRQMGRLSLFRDLDSTVRSKVISQLRVSIQDLREYFQTNKQIEIIIVGSMAGGTGAGILVDIAHLTRAIADSFATTYILRGFFVLPRAFTSSGLGENREMLARSYATWRELDRAMIMGGKFENRINYHAQNRDLHLRISKRPYDVAYLVDSTRQSENSLHGIWPEEGVFPVLAQCINTLLDPKAGQAYTDGVTTNMAGRLAQLPRRPYYSAIGSYTIKVPTYYIKENFIHRLTLDVLQELLAPKMNDMGKVVSVSEIHSKEVPQGYVGLQAALSFLNASAFNIAGGDVPNTKLLQLIATIRSGKAQEDGNWLNSVAQGELSNYNSRWMDAMIDIAQDELAESIIYNIIKEIDLAIRDEVPPSREFGDTPEDAINRIRDKVSQVRKEHYGFYTHRGEQLRGTYGDALERAKQAQLAYFGQLLKAWSEQTLNGESSDSLVARSGKIGYVQAFYKALAEACAYFVEFINKVRLVRNEDLRLALGTSEAAQHAWKNYQNDASKKLWLVFWDNFIHPKAHRVQMDYLIAEQRDINVRKDEILLSVLAETVEGMRRLVQQALADVDIWIDLLATGDGIGKFDGLYHTVQRSLDNININHELDKRLGKVVNIIGEQQYQRRSEYIAQALECLKWEVSMKNGKLQLIFGVEIMDEVDPAASPEYISFKRSGENSDQYNLDLILRLSEPYYRKVFEDRPIAREIQRVYETGKKLAQAVDKMSEPLFLASANPTGPQSTACYIQVHSDIDEQSTRYFHNFEDDMRARYPFIKGSNLTLVDSKDLHRLTIVRSDDLLPTTDFEMWHACRDAYLHLVTDPQRDIQAGELHIFPEEINACYYESRMPKLLQKEYRTLHPEVVALLQDRERIELFLKAFALDFIHIEEDNGQPYWVYRLPSDKNSIFITLPEQGFTRYQEIDIFDVIYNFVIDGRDQRPGLDAVRWIDWSKLRKAIIDREVEIGKQEIQEIYQKEYEGAAGFVNSIQMYIDHHQISNNIESIYDDQKYEDLADLAATVYISAVQETTEQKAGF